MNTLLIRKYLTEQIEDLTHKIFNCDTLAEEKSYIFLRTKLSEILYSLGEIIAKGE